MDPKENVYIKSNENLPVRIIHNFTTIFLIVTGIFRLF
jgi:hypothetical protein